MKKFAFHKIIMAVCLLLALMMLVCSCDSTGDGETQTTTAATTTEAPGNGDTPSGTTAGTQGTTADPNDQETPSTVTYKVTVIDETGAPVVGATVQLCVGNICKFPAFTGNDGVVTFDYEKNDYKALVTMEGYDCGDYVYFEEGSTELTITITKLPA